MMKNYTLGALFGKIALLSRRRRLLPDRFTLSRTFAFSAIFWMFSAWLSREGTHSPILLSNSNTDVLINSLKLEAESTTSGMVDGGGNFTSLASSIEPDCGAPGGIADNLAVWLQADHGVSLASGKNVNSWEDQSGNDYHLVQNNTARQPTWSEEAINYRPALDFEKSQIQFLESQDGGFYTNDYFVVFVPDNDIYAGGRQGNLISALDGGQRFDFGYSGFNSALNSEVFFHSVGQGYTYASAYTSQRQIIDSSIPYLINSKDNADGNGTDIYFNGLQINNEEVGAYTTISDLPFLVGTGANGDRSHDGKIAEVIIYNDRNNSAERRRIQSYLAIKYGITIDQAAENMDDRHYYNAAGNIIWNALLNQDYAHNIAGIGRDDASCLEQIQSKSQYTSALLRIGQANDLDEGEFLIWGHNGRPITKFGATPAPEGYFALNRVWRVQETGELGNLEIAFEKEALSRRVNTDYFLLADTNNDGSFVDETPRLFTLDGSTFKIAGVDLDDGVRFTIAINCASPRVENVPVREEYYLPLPENQLLDVLRTIYPSAADCNSSFVVREPREPVFNYTSVITQGQGTLIIYDHWEDGFESDLENPVQISTEIWGDGNLLNGHPPALPCDIIGAETIVLNESMNLDELGRGFIYDGGDRLGSSGPVAITKANWAEGARTLFAGAVEVYASEFWSKNYVVPFGENVSLSTSSLQYVGALVMAKENKTRLDIDLDGDGSTDQTVLLDQGKSHLINGGIQTGAMLTASAPIQVHLATGDVCDNFESRWFSLPGVNFTCDAYYSGVSDASVMYYFYNPNDVDVLIKHQTSAGSRTDILVPAKTHLTRFFETSDSDGHHFYAENDLNFYAAFFYSINDITGRGSAYDWGAMLICEDMLPRSLQIGWAYGQDPTLSPSENGSPIWLTAAYPTGSFSSGPIEVCVDFDGDNQGPLSDDNGRFYDQLLTLNEYEAARIFDPDGDQTGTIISICDGSDAILSVHWGADQDAGSAGSPGLDLGTGLPFTFPFYVDKWVEDENGDQVFEAQEKVFYTIDIIPVGQNIISGPFRIIDKLPLGLTYIPGSVEAIMPDGAVSSLNDDSGGQTSFPLDEAGLSIGQFRLIHPGEKLSVRFEARINKEFSGEVANTASVTQGVYQREDETIFEVSEEVTNFDLALRKQLNNSLTPGPFFPGDPVVFTIEVINQGAVDAKNIQINDYFPPGLLLDDPNWKDNGAGVAKMKDLILQLSAGASAVVDIHFIINPDFKGLSLINAAELQQAENDFGLADVDSQPDELQSNDAGGLALSSADNYIDGDGKGVPGDGLAETDEDDHDPAQIRVEQSFDLALRKTLNASLTPGPFKSGDPVTYTIEVYNQGSLSAQNIQINDYFPLSLDLTDSNWTEISPGIAQLKNPLSTLAAGANTSLEITFTIREDYQGERIVNYAEIGGAENEAGLEDRDSQFDANPVNDAGGGPESPADDYLLGDGEGSVGGGEATTDEDDHDPAVIAVEQRFDLALTKELNTELSSGPFRTGSKLNYTITIINQGSIDAQNIQVNDYFPSFLVLADNEWREEAPGVATLKTPIANLAPGASVSINIRFVIAPRFSEQSILNIAEIAAAENELGLADADSQADSQADNDGGGTPNSPADNATGGDGSGSPGDTNAETDEDDHDPAWILVEQIFDLALIKRVNTALTPGPFSPGDEVVFTIEIHNQGTLAAENIQINDYIPAGLRLADDDWTIVSPGLANLKRPLTSLEAEQTTSIDIRFLIDGDFLGNTLINTAEIASAENALNLNDLDSQADEDSANDAGGAPATLSDDALNGDGSGNPGDNEAAADEDDHDPAQINVTHIFDLALIKTVSEATPDPFLPGDPLVFNIEIHNQGTLEAQNIQVNDYIPAGLILADLNWTEVVPGVANLNTPIAALAAGQTISLDIRFIINEDLQSDQLINIAEIAAAENLLSLADLDSQADDLPNNDAGGAPNTSSDNALNGDGSGSPGATNAETDEDDHDPVQIRVEQSFDLALTKTLNTSLTPGPFKPGDLVTFTISVYNQGSLHAQNIEIRDYFPTTLRLNDDNWNDVGFGLALLKTPFDLAAGASTTFDISFNIQEGFQGAQIVNYAEIGGADNTLDYADRDSQADAFPANDAGGLPESEADDYILGDGSGAAGGGEAATDEDDHDPARIVVEQSFDLALTKTLNTELTPGPFRPGDEVVYTITIINQGSLDAQDIEINDYYFPADLTLADENWETDGFGRAVLENPIASLSAGQSASVHIRFIINPDFEKLSTLNIAEIAKASNLLNLADVDSRADDEAANDAGGVPNTPSDNALDGDGSGSPGATDAATDEDDHDPALIAVEQIFDLALIKRFNPSFVLNSFSPGGEVVFTFEIHNQGTIDAQNIQINDYIPPGLSLADDDWTEIAPGIANLNTPIVSLAKGQRIDVDIRFLIEEDFLGLNITNIAEIASAENTLGLADFDSRPDDIADNDAGGAAETPSDNVLNGDGSGNPGDANPSTDEDDQDPARITIEHVFDLALIKTLNEATPGPFSPGDPVVFTIEIHNQGTLAAQNIQINDYIPVGLTLADLNWSEIIPGVANLNTPIAGLDGGETIRLDIRFIINNDFQGDRLINVAEIAFAENALSLNDRDSQPDDTSDNDAGGSPNTPADDALDGDGSGNPNDASSTTDEDDHDPTLIFVEQSFDLALSKILNTSLTPGPFAPGDLVTYTINIFNQGSLDAYDIGINDYFPVGLKLSDNNWEENGDGLAVLKTSIANLPAGLSTEIDITFSVQNGFQGIEIVNYAEIGEAENLLGLADKDSRADDQADNDAGGLPESEADDYILGDGSGAAGDDEAATDEDDHDPARIVVEQSFDLALIKTLNTELTPGPFRPGDEVVYTITIINQGSLDAQAIEINDYYFPTDLTLADENWEADGFGRAVLENPMASLSVGQSASVDIRFIINPDFEKLSTLNIAEIAEASNLLNLADVDSRADDEAANDAGGVPNTPSDNALDGDGSGSPGATDAATDEDDHDPALIAVQQVFDLALVKKVNTTLTPGSFAPGGAVVFTIEIHNQGTLEAQNIQINDYIPAGLILADLNWIEIFPGIANLNSPIASLSKGETTSVDIRFLIREDFLESSITNIAEIAFAENAFNLIDWDSQADDLSDNDAGGAPATLADNALNGDGSGNPGDVSPLTDEDDHDPAQINIEITFDLALVKTLSESTPGPFVPGDEVVFTIEIHNQGSLDARNIELHDYFPSGLILADPAWSETDPGVARLDNPIVSLASGQMTTVDVRFTIDPAFQGASLINYAEISGAENIIGAADKDSQADNIAGNDAGGRPISPADDYLDGDGSGSINSGQSATDEDDHDPALLRVGQSFDLALTKTVNTTETPGPFFPAEQVTYTITVFNQASLNAQGVQINDYFPESLILTDNDWVEIRPGFAQLRNPIDVLQGGASETIDITFTIRSDFQETEIINYAEIGDANNLFGLPDEDSTPDDNDANDAGGLADSPADDYTLGDGAGSIGGGEAATDEDDHDPARIVVEQRFDLALIKELNTALTADPIFPGDPVVYTITVINQGNLDAQNIQINDYFPTELILADDSWSESSSGIATMNNPISNLSPGASISVDIRFTVDSKFKGLQILNRAEIAAAENILNLNDHDSQADDNADNDAGGAPESDADNAVEGNGSGAPGDTEASTDEDDQDPALIPIKQIFDLALIKRLNNTVVSNDYAPGDAVVFTIEIHNQGTLDAQNIQINDYIPAGLRLADLNWTEISPGIANLNEPISHLSSEQITSLTIRFLIDEDFQGGSIVNIAEIASATNEFGLVDEDSVADDLPDNDAGGAPGALSDDALNGDGSGNPGDSAPETDEDDQDPARVDVSQTFDLALLKRLSEDTPGPFQPGDPVTFVIEIYNQGNIDASNIQISDYIPEGLLLADDSWSENSLRTATLKQLIPDLAAGASTAIEITFTIDESFQGNSIVNYAEISAARNALDLADVDSDPDSQNDNDAGGEAGAAADDYLDGNGTGLIGNGIANTDEDDHDPARIMVEQSFDLALTKTLNTELTPGPFQPGDEVIYTITLINQGGVDAYDIQINDYFPEALTLADDVWEENSVGIANLKTQIGHLAAAASATIDIRFTINSDFAGQSILNMAEIAAAANSLDLSDRDSQADNIADNDAGGAPGSAADDAINGDASGLPGDTAAETDEDDHDPTTISIEQVFDLALIKSLNENLTPGPFSPGDPVVFSIEIHNQGTLEAQDIQISDYMPGGLNLADDAWTEVVPGVAQLNMPIASLAAQETVTVNIRFVIDRDFQGGGMVNFAEIAEATNALGLADRDSEADGIENNDAGGAPDTPADNSLNGDGGGSPGDSSAGTDEDDHDPAGILLGQTFDLALTKRPAEDVLYNPGDPLTFIIEIFNQGSLNASNIQISDYVPEGLSLNDANWSENSPGIATLNDPISSLAAGTSTTVNITFTIDDTFQGAEIVNYAEISDAENALGLADEDSRPDNQKDNDAGGSPGSEADDFKDGNGSGLIGDGVANTDEDDHDPAVIRVAQTFDLALVKRLDSDLTPGPFVPGDEVRFIIEVFNQGSLDASDIRISDYIPDGLNLNDPSWRENGAGIFTQDASIPNLAAGQSTTLSISFVIDESFQGDALINYAEISGAVNALGLIDIDSRLDNQNGNDAGGQAGSEADDVVDGNGTGLIGDGLAATDEDDHDPAVIAVEQTFDLALRKMLNTNVGQEPFAPGDELSFIIEVFNQGRLDAQNIQLNDYIPAGLILADDNWAENSVGVANLKNPIASLAAGETISLDIRFTVDPNFSEASLINLAEIAAAENALGLSDFDSRFDDQADNDAGGAPDSPADNAVDGDGTGLVGDELAATDEDDADAEAVDLCLALDAGSDGSVEVCIGCGVDPINVDLMSVLNGTPDDGGFWEDLSGAGVDLSDPSQVNFAGLALGSYFFRYTLGDGGNCGFVSAEARIDLHSFATMSCNNRIIFPLPSANGCSVQISPDLLLEGVRRCNAEYEVRLYDERGVFLGDVITGEQAGQTIIAEIHNLTCGNYCSGELVIEDSVAPEITCPENMADLVCSDADSILNNIASLAITGEPIIFDNCSINNQLSFTDQLVENGDCGDVTVARLFTLVDASDNESSCLQLITVRKPDFNDLTFPPEMVNLSCDSTFQLDGNGRPHPSVSGYPLVNTTYGSLPINQVYCNLGASYSDSEPISQCAATYAVVRTWTVVDWCAEATRDYSQIITVEDIVAPEVICRTKPGGEPDTLQFSTGPFNCTAAFAVPTPEINDNCSDWTVAVDVVTDVEVPVYDRFGRIVGTEIDTQIIASVAAGSNFPYVSNIPAGCHRFRYTVEDACGNTTIEECAFCVSDGVEPVAVCDNSLTVAIGGGGFGRLLADDLDEGSWDNCGLAGIGIRRQIARNEDCEEVAPEFSEWSDMIELNCCDVGQDLVVQLVAIDSSGNENICQSILRLADNIPPDCIAPPNRSIGCNELPFGFDPGDINDLQSLFGVASAEDNCMTATWEELTPSINLSECGDGYITRIFRATDAQGNLSVNTCQQALTIEKYHDYDIQFPADVVSACGQDNPPSVLALGRLGCNDMGVSIFDEVHTDIPGICSRTLRRYRVINWCEYDGESDQIIIGRDENCNGEGGEEAVWVLHRNGTTYIDRDNNPLNNAPSVGESQCSPDNPGGYWRTSSSTGFWEYTQYIDVIDENPAEIQFEAQGVFCSLQEDCNGVVTLPFTVVEDCDQLTFNLYFDENGDGSLDSQLDTEQSLRGNFPNYNVTAALPIGSHAIEVQMIEGCGTIVTARLDFSIADCLAPLFNCLDTLSFDLEPQYEGTDADGDGDIDLGAYTIEATDLALDMAIDCTGPVFYSISREGEDPDPAKTRLIVTCDDPDTMRVKVYAWDQAFNPYLSQPDGSVGGPNYGYCETILLVKDELFNACGGGFHPGEISGVILTEVDNPVEGVAVNLSGPNSLQYATGVDGAYIFDNLEEGFDYTVTPRLNLDHRNGVSTFDLTLLEKHILGVKRLDTPYKLIAADINRSGTISVFDVVQMRKLILGEVDAFEYNTSWRFVRADHVFIDPTNPFAGFLPEVITLNNLFEPFEDGDFIGIKIGDVNLTAIANSDMGVAPRALNDTIRFLLNDQVVQAGNIYQIPFYLPALNEVEGFQYTLEVDRARAKILGVEAAEAKDANFGLRYSEEGLLTSSWHRDASAPIWTPTDSLAHMFTLILEAEADGRLSEFLSLNSRITAIEAYDREGLIKSIALTYEEENKPSDQPRLYQNYPNPFGEKTTIGFYLPRATDIRFSIRDIRGRLLFTQEGWKAAGEHQISLEQAQLEQSGVYYYTLITGDGFKASKKMIRK